MSNSKLQKTIERIDGKLVSFNNNSNPRPTFILTDSKGFSLERAHCEINPSLNIQFFSEAGAGIQSNVHCDRLLDSIRLLPQTEEPLVLVWFGTCELTQKLRRYTCLRNRNEERIDILVDLYITYRNLIYTINSKATVIFLEVPHYSIIAWNECKGHPNPRSFLHDQSQLSRHIDALNSRINTLNHQTGILNFKRDLVKTTKRKTSHAYYNLNFKLYKDGIHPSRLLAELWIKKIYLLIQQYC